MVQGHSLRMKGLAVYFLPHFSGEFAWNICNIIAEEGRHGNGTDDGELPAENSNAWKVRGKSFNVLY